ncbi:uncharacterized protein LOC127285995 [Leptopilina boulardi]|uniref:uncharacterized protein LOC127285995 n=1 Tax=Leptopilina boulardi TaxID=63433 RepID=UPI0021F5C739|nr:uncharacterized protein LOC127285995 [Leptopilina boulardi]XP_051168205.1 uncharacterized protein LOC127285995 [Leptopilina boulardi]
MSKPKNKKPGKSNKFDRRNLDLSELQKPIKISVSSLKEAANLLDTGTPEIKDLLNHEVNLLYECRICRSIFRSLLNLISHKRAFCQDKFNGSGNRTREYANSVTTTENLELDQIILDGLVNPSKNDRILRSQAPVKANKADLTSVVHMLQKKQVEKLCDVPTETSELQTDETDCHQVVLQVLDSKRAAYQTLVQPNLSSDDLMENQVIELDNILSQDSAVLRADGQIEKSDSPVQFYGEEDTNRLVCNICSLTFMTQQTFDSHFRIKHAAVRDCYLCPFNSCTASFSSSMGVKRHLTNVHKKIGQELKTLSQQIEKRTVRSKPLNVVVNKKSKKSDNFDDNSLETQQWVQRIDSTAMHECISCGEKFDGKSELVIHLKHCLSANVDRMNNLLYEGDAECEENVIKDSEINEVPVLNLSNDSLTEETHDVPSEIECLPIQVQGIARISEEEWSKIPSRSSEDEDIIAETPPKFDNNRGIVFCPRKKNGPLITENLVLPVGNYLTSLDYSRKRKSTFTDVNSTVVGEKLNKITCQEYETDNNVIKKKPSSSQHFSETIASISDHTKLECTACRLSFSNITSLNRHMENHIKINRFRCKKCDFKSTSRNDCVGHCNRVHNAMNNRQVLNEMISQVSQDQLTQSQGMITVDPSNLNSNVSRQVNSQFGNNNSTTNLLRTRNNAIKNSELRNPSDTDTEPEDREAINRKIDANPNLPELIQEIVVGTNTTSRASTSNVNGQSRLTNNNIERVRKEQICDYSPSNSEFMNTLHDSDNNEYEKFDPWDRQNNLSRASNRSDYSMTTRSCSRLSKKINSETDEDDDITPELYKPDSDSQKKSKSYRRSKSRSSMHSNSAREVRSESRMMTRSRSRLGSKISLNEDIDDSIYDPRSETLDENKIERPKSRAKKEEVKEKRRRGRPKKGERRSAPGKIGESTTSRRESFSSESSQIQRPVRSRVKHVEKDFIYDLEDDNFIKSQSHYSKKSFEQNGISSNEELTILQNVTNPDSSVELESQELFFRGFPRQPEILNID